MTPAHPFPAPAFAPGRTLVFLCALLALAGCQRASPTENGAENGSARFVIAVNQALSEEDVVRVDVTVEAPDIPAFTVPLAEDGAVWTGLISQLRAGTGRHFLALAYDASDRLIYRGEASDVTITANQTVQVNILAQQVEPSEEYSNRGPVITSLVVSRSTVEPGGFVDVQATATDPDGEVLTYAWSAQAGAFDTASSPRARWTAPQQTGTVVLTLSVADPSGASTSISFPILVEGAGFGEAEVFVHFNSWPQVDSMTGSPTHVNVGTAVAVSAQASDPDGAPASLTYTWTASCAGTWANANSAAASFTPTALPGSATCDNCELRVRVEDGRGGEGLGRLGICVGTPTDPSFPPRIINAYQTSRRASPGTTILFRVQAEDPEGTALGFTWEANVGTLAAPSGDAGSSTVVWTAPACVDAQVTPLVRARVADASGLVTWQPFELTWNGPACPTQLTFSTQPSDAFATVALSPAVQVSFLDSLGRVVPSVSGRTVTVSLGNNPGGGVLSGAVQATASLGVATFPDLAVDAPGVGYTLVAVADGLPAVTSNPFTLTPLRVEGRRIDTLIGTDNVLTQRVNDLSATPISALVEQPDGSFQTFPGVGRADGTFTIEGVPAGAYYLRVGPDYFVTTSRAPDLGVVAQGRPGSAAPSSTTYLAMSLQGLESWANGADLQVFSPGVGLWSHGIQGLHVSGTRPAPGDASWNQTIRYQPFQGSRLVEAAQGDSLTFHQLSVRTPGGAEAGETYTAASRAFTTSTLTVVDGATTTVSGTLTALPQTGALSVDWRMTSFEALRTSVHPSASLAGHALYVGAFPDGTRGTYTAAPDLMSFAPGSTGRDRSFSFSYGNPYPGFTEAGHVETAFSVALAPPLATPFSFYTSVSSTAALPELAASPLQARLGPARTPRIQARDAFSTQLGVGLTPRLEWSAPSVGQPTSYLVRISEVTVNAGAARLGTVVGQLYTAGTHVIVPPGMLTTGRYYFAQLVARSSANSDFQTRPLRSAWPEAEATVITGVFAP